MLFLTGNDVYLLGELNEVRNNSCNMFAQITTIIRIIKEAWPFEAGDRLGMPPLVSCQGNKDMSLKRPYNIKMLSKLQSKLVTLRQHTFNRPKTFQVWVTICSRVSNPGPYLQKGEVVWPNLKGKYCVSETRCF